MAEMSVDRDVGTGAAPVAGADSGIVSPAAAPGAAGADIGVAIGAAAGGAALRAGPSVKGTICPKRRFIKNGVPSISIFSHSASD